MTTVEVSLLLGGTSAVAAVALIRAIVTHIHAREWNTSASFVLALAVVLNLKPALGAYLHNVVTTTDVFHERVLIYPGELNRLIQYSDRLLLAVAAVLVVRGIRERHMTLGPSLLALLLLAIGCIAGAAGGNTYGNSQTLFSAMILCTAFLPGGLGACLGAGTFGVGLALASGLLTVSNYSGATQPCTYKCGPLGVLVQGVAENENALGLGLALSVPFVYLAFTNRYRIWLTSYVVFMAVATGSRTAQIAALTAFVALLVIRPSTRAVEVPNPPRLQPLLRAALLGIATVGLLAPFFVRGSSLTERGNVWAVARQGWGAARWFGNGVLAWSHLGAEGTISAAATYSAHNEWLDLLYATGAVGLVVFIAFLLALFRIAGKPQFNVVAVILVPVFVCGITERPWSFTGVDWLSWSLVAAILAARAAARPPDNIGHPTQLMRRGTLSEPSASLA